MVLTWIFALVATAVITICLSTSNLDDLDEACVGFNLKLLPDRNGEMEYLHYYSLVISVLTLVVMSFSYLGVVLHSITPNSKMHKVEVYTLPVDESAEIASIQLNQLQVQQKQRCYRTRSLDFKNGSIEASEQERRIEISIPTNELHVPHLFSGDEDGSVLTESTDQTASSKPALHHCERDDPPLPGSVVSDDDTLFHAPSRLMNNRKPSSHQSAAVPCTSDNLAELISGHLYRTFREGSSEIGSTSSRCPSSAKSDGGMSSFSRRSSRGCHSGYSQTADESAISCPMRNYLTPTLSWSSVSRQSGRESGSTLSRLTSRNSMYRLNPRGSWSSYGSVRSSMSQRSSKSSTSKDLLGPWVTSMSSTRAVGPPCNIRFSYKGPLALTEGGGSKLSMSSSDALSAYSLPMAFPRRGSYRSSCGSDASEIILPPLRHTRSTMGNVRLNMENSWLPLPNCNFAIKSEIAKCEASTQTELENESQTDDDAATKGDVETETPHQPPKKLPPINDSNIKKVAPSSYSVPGLLNRCKRLTMRQRRVSASVEETSKRSKSPVETSRVPIDPVIITTTPTAASHMEGLDSIINKCKSLKRRPTRVSTTDVEIGPGSIEPSCIKDHMPTEGRHSGTSTPDGAVPRPSRAPGFVDSHLDSIEPVPITIRITRPSDDGSGGPRFLSRKLGVTPMPSAMPTISEGRLQPSGNGGRPSLQRSLSDPSPMSGSPKAIVQCKPPDTQRTGRRGPLASFQLSTVRSATIRGFTMVLCILLFCTPAAISRTLTFRLTPETISQLFPIVHCISLVYYCLIPYLYVLSNNALMRQLRASRRLGLAPTRNR